MLDLSSRPERNWSWPTSILFGAGRVADLPGALRDAGASRPLVVTDAALVSMAPVQSAIAVLRGAGVPFGLFSAVQPNPTGEAVDAGVAAFVAGGHDSVIAIGGGSALDAGKAVALMVRQSRPIWDFEDVGDNWKRVDTSNPVPVVAVPTTAGTGSELGRSSIITDTGAGRKMIIFHPVMMPDVAILDPDLTVGLPPALTASTGMDALCHALETFITPNFHPMADGLALQALRMIKVALPCAYADGADLEARSDMLVASGMACVALQKGLGGVHALSHALGAVYDLPHGLLNAILLPHVVTENLGAARQRLTELAGLLDLPGGEAESVIAWLVDLRATLGIPGSLRAIGVSRDRLQEVIALAVQDPCAAANPLPFDEDVARQMLGRAMA
ncbi:iron-containing alcohol dehydrogenase [Acidimangrovimonas sediminis]|uniref:iron-containing alcohol dehydrogenase n=1 Tax=Acidimangrovimonas sediminis TaxID=2056283 RepID=UPI000C802C5F|nr:iron-containing alcohol dehydrogenase [Acidimangrovimonas sediminis]